MVAIAQVMSVILGFFALGIVLKACGYPESPEGSLIRWSPLAVGLRSYGLLLLGVPIAWVGYAIAAARMEKGVFSTSLSMLSGFFVVGCIGFFFLWAMFFPFSRVVLIVR